MSRKKKNNRVTQEGDEYQLEENSGKNYKEEYDLQGYEGSFKDGADK